LEQYKGVLDRQRTFLDREYARYLIECNANSKEAKDARGRLREAKVRTRTTPYIDQGVYLGEGPDWTHDALQTRLTLARRHIDPSVRRENAPQMGPAQRIVGGAGEDQADTDKGATKEEMDRGSPSETVEVKRMRQIRREMKEKHMCHWCHFPGHFDADCDAPHQGC